MSDFMVDNALTRKDLAGGGVAPLIDPVNNDDFGFRPDQEDIPIVDAYSPTALNDIADGQHMSVVKEAKKADTVEKTVAPEAKQAILSDPKTKVAAKSKGLQVEHYVANVVKTLPPDVNTEVITREVSVVTIENDTPGLLKAAKSKGLKDKGTDFLKTGLMFAEKVGGFAEVVGLKDKLNIDIGLGIKPFDGISEGGVVIAVIEEILKKTSKASIIKKIPILTLHGTIAKYIIREIAKLCARYGSWKSLRDIALKYPKDINSTTRDVCIELFMKNYRKTGEDFSKGKVYLAESIISALDIWKPGWDRMQWGAHSRHNYDPWNKASLEICEILMYHDRTLYCAAIRRHGGINPKNHNVNVKEPIELTVAKVAHGTVTYKQNLFNAVT